MIGDPFAGCQARPIVEERIDPCVPSPCGPFSQCRQVGDRASCTCLENYIGSPPNCRPECTIDAECPQNLACVNQRCSGGVFYFSASTVCVHVSNTTLTFADPCLNACGFNAFCKTVLRKLSVLVS